MGKRGTAARRFAPVLFLTVLTGIVLVLCLNRPSKNAVQRRLTELDWVSENGAEIRFLPSGEAHIRNPSRDIDVVGTYAVYRLRSLFNDKIIVDVSIHPDERYAEYVLDGNILTSENGFCYHAVS